MKNRNEITALAFIAFMVIVLLWQAAEAQHHAHFPYQAQLFFALALLLVCFYRRAVQGVLWVCREVYRLLSMALLFVALMIEGGLHLFHIPHVEGWWIPLIGGGAAASGAGAWAWFRQWRKRAQ